MAEYPESALSRFWARVRATCTGRPVQHEVIDFDDEGLRVHVLRVDTPPRTTVDVSWQKVVRAIAFKKDLLIHDHLCVAFELDDGSAFEIGEDMEGWKPLVKSLPNLLPGSTEFHRWWMDVAFPAFDQCAQTIFKKGV
jgi:hypothetical protein